MALFHFSSDYVTPLSVFKKLIMVADILFYFQTYLMNKKGVPYVDTMSGHLSNCPFVCSSVSATILFIRFSLISVQEFFTNSHLAYVSLMNIGLVGVILCLSA